MGLQYSPFRQQSIEYETNAEGSKPTKNFSKLLSDLDNTIIPNCCHPTIPERTPVKIYIKCVMGCPKVIEWMDVYELRI